MSASIDRRLARYISGRDVSTVPERGWAAVKNGELLTPSGARVRCVDLRIFGAGYWRRGKAIYEREKQIHGRAARKTEDRS
jgi:hypothetical protein